MIVRLRLDLEVDTDTKQAVVVGQSSDVPARICAQCQQLNRTGYKYCSRQCSNRAGNARRKLRHHRQELPQMREGSMPN